MDGFSVVPEELADAADDIGAALGEPATPPRVAAPAAYGHAALGNTIAEFSSAVGLSTDLLTQATLGSADALRATAAAYIDAEQATVVALNGSSPR